MIKGLPERLQQMRSKYGYSQKQIADKLGLSPSIISAYETGERTPSTEVLLSISYIYNCSIDFLLGKQQETPPFIFNTDGLTNKQINAIQSLIESILEK